MKNIINKLFLLAFNLIIFLNAFAQTPQNVTRGKGKGESAWDSTTTIILIIAFFILMIVSRTWAKKIQNKRDQNTEKDEDEEKEKK